MCPVRRPERRVGPAGFERVPHSGGIRDRWFSRFSFRSCLRKAVAYVCLGLRSQCSPHHEPTHLPLRRHGSSSSAAPFRQWRTVRLRKSTTRHDLSSERDPDSKCVSPWMRTGRLEVLSHSRMGKQSVVPDKLFSTRHYRPTVIIESELPKAPWERAGMERSLCASESNEHHDGRRCSLVGLSCSGDW